MAPDFVTSKNASFLLLILTFLNPAPIRHSKNIAIPEEILTSDAFSKNELAQLAGIEVLPNETDVNDFKLIELSEVFLEHEDDAKTLEIELQKIAKSYLLEEKIEEAWSTLLAFNN